MEEEDRFKKRIEPNTRKKQKAKKPKKKKRARRDHPPILTVKTSEQKKGTPIKVPQSLVQKAGFFFLRSVLFFPPDLEISSEKKEGTEKEREKHKRLQRERTKRKTKREKKKCRSFFIE